MAAIEVRKEKGLDIVPEIMIPLVGMKKELADVKATVVKTVEKVMEREGVKFDYLIGTMIEIPRAALTADEIEGSGILLLRNQRPDADDLWFLQR